MTPQKAQEILLLSLNHTQRSRADYFRQTATEGGYNPTTFYLDLSEAYTRIESYVNTKIYDEWEIGENGERIYRKQTLNLYYATGRRVNGYLSNAAYGRSDGEFGLLEILEPLHTYGQSIIDKENSRSDDFAKKIADHIIQSLDTLKFPPKPTNAQKAVFLHYLIAADLENEIQGKSDMTQACTRHLLKGNPNSIYVEYRRIGTPRPNAKHPDPLTLKNAQYVCRYMLDKYPKVKTKIANEFPAIQDEIEE